MGAMRWSAGHEMEYYGTMNASPPPLDARRQHAYSRSSFDDKGIPVDKKAMSYRIMVLLGCGLLLPWNAVLTAFDYFQNLYDDDTFTFAVPIANQVPNFIVIMLMVRYG